MRVELTKIKKDLQTAGPSIKSSLKCFTLVDSHNLLVIIE